MTLARQPFRPIAILTVLALGLGLVGLTGPNSASSQVSGYAYHGCQFRPEHINPISFAFHQVNFRNRIAMDRGATKWNRTNAPGSFRRTSYYDPEINVYDYSFGARDIARVRHYGCPGGYYFGEEVTLTFNLDFLLNYNYDEWGTIAAHELGHVYGLDHVDDCTLMVDNAIELLDECGVTGPTGPDIIGVYRLYR